MNERMIRLFLADDHTLVRQGIAALIARTDDMEVVGQCGNGLEAPDQVQAARPDVLVLDISLPGMNGLEVCRSVKAKMPEIAVLMLSMNASERIVAGALANGASGYLTKEAVASELCQAIHAVARGEIYLGRGIPRTILEQAKQP